MDSLMVQLRHGLNLPRPVPWPWTLDLATLASAAGRAGWAAGFVFLLLPVVYGIGVVSSLRREEPYPARNLLAAATTVGLAYAHHASVRSGIPHLAQAVHPLWLAAVAIPHALPPRFRRTALGWAWAGAALLSLAVVPAANHQIRLLMQRDLAVLRVGADTVRMPRAAVAALSTVQRAVERQLGPRDALFLAPDLAGLYPAFGRTSPIHLLYLIWPTSPEAQRSIIGQLEERRVRVALISAGAPDGRKEETFPYSHPLVWDYLRTRFDLMRVHGLAPQFLLFVRREARAERSSRDDAQ
jgi:hypothetical protein